MNRKRLIMLWTLVANASSLIACSQWQEHPELCFAAGSAGAPGQLGVSDPKWLLLKVALWLDCFEMLLNSHLFVFSLFFSPLVSTSRGKTQSVNSIWSCDRGWLHLNKAVMVACRVAVSFQNRKWGCRCSSDRYKKACLEKGENRKQLQPQQTLPRLDQPSVCSGENISSMLSPCLRGYHIAVRGWLCAQWCRGLLLTANSSAPCLHPLWVLAVVPASVEIQENEIVLT